MSSGTYTWLTCRVTIFAIPVGALGLPGPLNPIYVPMAAAALAGSLRLLRGHHPPKITSTTFFLVAAAVLANALALRSPNPAGALQGFLTGAICLVFALTLAGCISSPQRLAVVVRDVATVGTVCAVWALLTAGTMTAHFDGASVTGRAVGPFAQPNELGLACAATLPFAILSLLERDKDGPTSLLATGRVLLIGAALTTSLSRGAWVGAIAALVVLAVVWPRYRRGLTLLVAVVTVAVGVLVLVGNSGGGLDIILDRVGSLGRPGANPSDDRSAFWAEALRQFATNPWLGTGPDGYVRVSSQGASRVGLAEPLHPHNLYLEILVRGGVVLLALLAAAALSLLRDVHRVWRLGRAEPSAPGWVVAPLAGVVALAVHGLIDVPFANPGVRCLAWTVMGLCVAVSTHVSFEPTQQEPQEAPDDARTTSATPERTTMDRGVHHLRDDRDDYRRDRDLDDARHA